MKKFVLCMIALAMLSVSLLQSQNAQKMAGAWQGTLKAPNGQALRIVVKVSFEDDKLKAVLHSIDQRTPPIPANTFTLDGSTAKMTIAAMNATYEGKVSADGNAMAGTWSQGGPGAPLDFVRATPETAFTAVQQQLGLKLDSTRAPADVVVIDRIERPSEN